MANTSEKKLGARGDRWSARPGSSSKPTFSLRKKSNPPRSFRITTCLWALMLLAILLLSVVLFVSHKQFSAIDQNPDIFLRPSQTIAHTHKKSGALQHNISSSLGSSASIQNHSTVVHRAFILVGGVRTLNQTHHTILHNLIFPMCAPPTCIAHLVIHFSRADNRPGGKDEHYGGKVLAADSNDDATIDFFGPLSNDYLVVHHVDGYEIGSAEEQRAMDVMESEIDDPVVVHRLRALRFGDPRRYSMWFARAWAWRFFENKLRIGYDFDFFVFCRPDMLWLLPAPAKSFFDDIGLNKTRDIWVQALYYADAADVFAFLPSLETARIYFPLRHLVREGVACLGGPAIDQSVVKQVLVKKDIAVEPDLWCADEGSGWSERILRRKLLTAGANVRYIHASSVILRPPSQPECQCAATKFLSGWARIPNSHVPMISCLMAERMIKKGHNATSLIQKRPIRIHGNARMGHSNNMCLSWNETSNSITPSTCEFPYPPVQLFFTFDDEWYGYIGIRSRYEVVPLNATQVNGFLQNDEWMAENVELYGAESHVEKPW